MAGFTSRAKEWEERGIQSVFNGPVKPVVCQFDLSTTTNMVNVCWYKVLNWASRGGKSSCCKNINKINLSNITAMSFRVKDLGEMCQSIEGRKKGLKRAQKWQVISDVNSGEWDGNWKERVRERGWDAIVLIVKTSDDSLCPLCGDCSLINLAAEILPPWAKMRIAFPLFLLLLLLDVFRCWRDEMSQFL